jgi:heme A synthase
MGVLLATQLFLGARLSIVDRFAVALPVHGLLALVLSALLAWVALARVRGAAGKLLFALALAAPIAGFTTLQYEHSGGAALAHAAAAALLLATAAYAFGRGA